MNLGISNNGKQCSIMEVICYPQPTGCTSRNKSGTNSNIGGGEDNTPKHQYSGDVQVTVKYQVDFKGIVWHSVCKWLQTLCQKSRADVRKGSGE